MKNGMSAPNFEKDSINRLSGFIFNSSKKKFIIVAASEEPPPSPAPVGIFFSIFIF